MNSDAAQSQVSIGDILSDAWQVFRSHFQDIVVATLVVSIPLNVILVFLPKQNPEEAALNWYVTGAAMVIALVAALASTIAVLGTMFIAEKGLQGERVSWDAALRHGLSRWFASFWTSLLAGVMLIGLFLLLIVPGIIFAVYWSFAMALVALRGMEGMSALRYSRSLVQGRWWKTFGYVLAFGILSGICVLIVSGVGGLVSESTISGVVVRVVTSVVSAFFNVVSAIMFLRFEATKTEEPAPAVVAQ